MIISFILLILILISSYFVNSKEHLISTNPGGQKITYEGDAIRYTCGDTDQVIHNDQGGVIQSSHILDASIELNPSDNQGDVYYGTDSTSTANKIQCKCKNGYSVDPADSTKCICPAGNYITNGNCVGCPTGKYQNATGQPSCKPPPPGKHVNSTATGFTDCPAGTYAPPLTVGSAFGHAITSCWSCPVGRYQDETGQTSCKYPVAGKRSSTDKLKEIDCELGTWSSISGARENCAKPPAGKYANGGEFQNCAAGTWADSSIDVRSACNAASVGNYVAGIAAISQTPCDAGMYQDDTGQTSCKTPVAGKRASTDKQKEIPCELGTWSTNDGAREHCGKPGAGEYADATGFHYCAAGTFAANTTDTRSACTIAYQGHYVGDWLDANGGRTYQSACPTGKYQDATGQTSCKNASIGHVVGGTGRWYQDNCHQVWGPTKYQDATGQSSCKTYTEQDRTYSSTGNTGALHHHSPGTGHARSMLDSQQAWSSAHSGEAYYGTDTWIKIDLKYSRWVRGLVTQGRRDAAQWVKTYLVKYSVDNQSWDDAYPSSPAPRVADTTGSTEFRGNTDQNTKVESVFTAPILARYIRIIPYTTHIHSSMRVGVLFPQ